MYCYRISYILKGYTCNCERQDAWLVRMDRNHKVPFFIIIIIRLGFNVALTHQNRSYRDRPFFTNYPNNDMYVWSLCDLYCLSYAYHKRTYFVYTEF